MLFAGSERSHEKGLFFSPVEYINKVSGADTIPWGSSSLKKIMFVKEEITISIKRLFHLRTISIRHSFRQFQMVSFYYYCLGGDDPISIKRHEPINSLPLDFLIYNPAKP
jgi:hypothetical protein